MNVLLQRLLIIIVMLPATATPIKVTNQLANMKAYSQLFALESTINLDMHQYFNKKFAATRTCTIPNPSNRTCIQLPVTSQKINPEVIIVDNNSNETNIQTGWDQMAKMVEVVLLSSVILSKVRESASQAC